MAYVGATPARKALTSSDISDGIITAGKIATDAVETAKVKDLNVSTGKLAADAVTNAKTEFTPGLEIKGDGASASGKLTLNCEQNTHAVHIESPAHSAGATYTLTLPTGVGTDGQVLATDGTTSNQLTWVDAVETKPTISTSSLIAEPTTNTTLTLAGANFVSIPVITIIASTGAIVTAPTVSFTSSSSLQFTTGTTLVAGTYKIRVENPDGNAGVSGTSILNISAGPIWTTAAGSLGSFGPGVTLGTLVAYATGDTPITYTETTSVITTFGGSLATVSNQANITGTAASPANSTIYTFTLRATDTDGQTSDREFTVTISVGLEQGMAFI